MSEFKGTPGPWVLDAEHFGNINHISHEYHFIEAGCGFINNATGKGFSISGCIFTEDARLITAAPDLLEALQNMVEAYQHEASIDNPALLEARMAIDKALGK